MTSVRTDYDNGPIVMHRQAQKRGLEARIATGCSLRLSGPGCCNGASHDQDRKAAGANLLAFSAQRKRSSGFMQTPPFHLDSSQAIPCPS